MPFPYFGSKHRLSRHYPRPLHSTIIEPFAGAAGYASRYAALPSIQKVLLFDADQYVVDLWHRLQRMTAAEVETAMRTAVANERTSEPLLAFCCGSSTIQTIRNGGDAIVTQRMVEDCGLITRRIQRTLPYLHKFHVTHGTYADAPDIEATWFIDPPYQSLISPAGRLYAHGAQRIDYDALATWCEQRSGQVMVCEQAPAAWLPFQPFRMHQTSLQVPDVLRLELLWYRCDRTPTQLGLFDD